MTKIFNGFPKKFLLYLCPVVSSLWYHGRHLGTFDWMCLHEDLPVTLRLASPVFCLFFAVILPQCGSCGTLLVSHSPLR